VKTRDLNDQTVVITGASSGIGRAAALEFGKAGANVVATARSGEDLDTLVGEITEAGGTAVAVPADVTDFAALQHVAATAEERFGRIDTWVNNAAVSVYGRIEEIEPEEFDRVMRVNFLGQVHGVKAGLPALRRAGGGVIIGVGSVESYRAVPAHAPYTASKFAVRALYDVLRMELAADGDDIAVTTILPGGISTPLFEHARTKLDTMPKPPPPVYTAEVVARAIVRAAVHPTREVPVGGAALGFILGQRFSPALTDALFSIPRLGFGSQISDNPDDPRDNLDAPMSGTGRTAGLHEGRVWHHSAFTSVLGQRRRVGEAVTGAVAGIRRITNRD
jgi:NAD(P)-dependent dehydrogenase (short-subunit alcohol dehydrogenase family)